MDLIALLISGLLIFGGIKLIHISIKLLKKIQLINNSDEVSIFEAVNRDDIVQINGTAKKYNDVLNSPLSTEECFVYNYKIEKYVDRNNWKEIESGTDTVDFIVQDNSGTAYIHTKNAKTLLDTKIQEIWSSNSDIPDKIKEHDFAPSKFMGIDISNKLRLKEGMIKPNEDVFVIGKYNNRNTKNDETIEIKPEEEIYISDKSTKQSISYLKRKSITYFILGISIILLISHNIISEFGLL